MPKPMPFGVPLVSYFRFNKQITRDSYQPEELRSLTAGLIQGFPIEQDDHSLTVLCYIERNPLRPGLVEQAEACRWSSLRIGERLVLSKELIVVRWNVLRIRFSGLISQSPQLN
jgi:hypothetical protein